MEGDGVGGSKRRYWRRSHKSRGDPDDRGCYGKGSGEETRIRRTAPLYSRDARHHTTIVSFRPVSLSRSSLTNSTVVPSRLFRRYSILKALYSVTPPLEELKGDPLPHLAPTRSGAAMAMISWSNTVLPSGECGTSLVGSGSVYGACQRPVIDMQLLLHTCGFPKSVNSAVSQFLSIMFSILTTPISGMPIQTSTDCGSETVLIYGFANALQ